nr:right-handed parallel beta-helix repeat-containing protein [uncultured Methanolobus sp.]
MSGIGTVSAQEIMVGSGLGNTTITAALANASDGDIITVTDGTYTENVDVSINNISIRSQNGRVYTTIQASSSSDYVFDIDADNVTVSGFNITGATDVAYTGIHFNSGASNCTISNNTVTGNYRGIFLSHSDYITLSNNIVLSNYEEGIYFTYADHCLLSNNDIYSNGDDGIFLDYSDYCTLTGNNASHNSDDGIDLEDSNNNTVTNNVFDFNEDYGLECDDSYYNTFEYNTFSNNEYVGILIAQSDYFILTNNTVNGNDEYGILIGESDYCILTNNTASYNTEYAGIYLFISDYCTLSGNIVLDNSDDGIYLDDSDYCSLTDNDISSNGNDGIFLGYSDYCTLTGNNASHNSDDGIDLEDSNNNIVTNNTFDNNYNDGFDCDDSDHNTFADNTFNSNDEDGIDIEDCYNNTLANNTLSYNEFGIWIENSDACTLTDNIMSSNDYNFGLLGSSLEYYFNDIDTSNLVDSKPIYYWLNRSDEVVPADAGNVYAINCSNVSVMDAEITNEYYGVIFAYTNNSTIENVTISECYDSGIYIYESNNNSVIGNTVTNTYDGIEFEDSYYGIITNNIANSNEDDGIELDSADYCTVTNNTINENDEYGIYLYDSDNNTLTSNIAETNDYGFYFTSSNNCTFADNQADNNTYALYLSSSENNSITPLILGDDLAELEFISNDSTTTISRTETNANSFTGKTNVNGYIEISSVLSSMNMSLFYSDSGMTSSNEATLALYKLNGTEWEEVNAMVDTTANTVTVNLTEFGTFALFKNSESTATTTTTSSSSGTRASVSQGQEPSIVGVSASAVKRITGDSEVNYDFSDSGTPVLGISFDATKDKGLVVAKVQVLSSNPDGVPSPSGKSYQMLSIDVGSEGTISSDSADNLKIHFKVSREWIEDNDIDISTIRMTRYHGDQWNDLPTYQEREEEGYIYFYAETPGFSIFEVVGDEIKEVPEQTPVSAPAVEDETEPAEDETPDTPGFTGFISLVFVSFAVYFHRRSE